MSGLKRIGGVLAFALLAGTALAAPRARPLLDTEGLFVSPCGEPFRSKPGEPYPVVAWFNRADKDHDGRLDKAEFRADCEAFFHVLDRNKDGVVDDHEINYYEKVIVPEITVEAVGRLDRFGGARLWLAQGISGIDPGTPVTDGQEGPSPRKPHEGDGPPQGAAGYGLLADPEPVRNADRELRGRIKLDAFLKNADRNFDRLDPDGRGWLTLTDLPPTPAEIILEREHRQRRS